MSVYNSFMLNRLAGSVHVSHSGRFRSRQLCKASLQISRGVWNGFFIHVNMLMGVRIICFGYLSASAEGVLCSLSLSLSFHLSACTVCAPFSRFHHANGNNYQANFWIRSQNDSEVITKNFYLFSRLHIHYCRNTLLSKREKSHNDIMVFFYLSVGNIF